MFLIFAYAQTAHWRAKLGFVVGGPNSKDQPHCLKVHRINDIVAGGGNLPQIDLFVLERSPLQFLEEVQAENVPRRVITEEAEIARRHQLEKQQSSFVERVHSEVLAECSKVRRIMLVPLSSQDKQSKQL
jgi:hypothetical protein